MKPTYETPLERHMRMLEEHQADPQLAKFLELHTRTEILRMVLKGGDGKSMPYKEAFRLASVHSSFAKAPEGPAPRGREKGPVRVRIEELAIREIGASTSFSTAMTSVTKLRSTIAAVGSGAWTKVTQSGERLTVKKIAEPTSKNAS